ncbi:hypothetical protein BgiMline_011696 [Biomphalaria glabrata]
MSSANKIITDGVIETKLTVDPLMLHLVILVVGCVFTVFVCLFGIAANIVNIPLFRKLGYQDGVITLTALAISDLGGLISELVFSVIMDPYILEVDLVVSKVVIGFITGFLFEYFTRVSGVITAYAALERRAEVFPVTYYVTDMILPCSTYIVLITCCTTLFVKLKSKAKWRQQVSSSGVSHITSKERKSARMFMTVSFMAVVLLLPQSLVYSAVIFIKALAIDGEYIMTLDD